MGLANPSGANRTDVTGASIIAGAVVVTTSATSLRRIIVTTVNGANPVSITDGPGGPIISIVAASAAAGTILSPDILVKTSINIPQTAGAGSLAIGWD